MSDRRRKMYFIHCALQLNELKKQCQRRRIKRRKLLNSKLLAIQELDQSLDDWVHSQILSAAINCRHFRRPRGMTKIRSRDFWDNIVQNHFDDNDWVANFRMRKVTFNHLCAQLRPELEPNELSLQIPLSVEIKVAMTLYKMASCCEYRIVANQFGVSKSAVHTSFYSVVNAFNRILVPSIVVMPNAEEAQEIVDAYENKYKFPQVIGAINGTHIPILPPSDGYRDYINRKGWPSIFLQAVVDHRFRFRNISCQFPGSCHDAKVLRASLIFINSELMIPNVIREIEGMPIPLMILGDPAYPLLHWLMKGYTHSLLMTPEEESYNVYLSSARMSVEIAFGRLKARWRCLSKRMDISHKFVPKVVAAACALHNLVEDNKEVFIEQWLENIQLAEIHFPQPANQAMRENVHQQNNMAAVRDHLRDYLAANHPLRQGTF